MWLSIQEIIKKINSRLSYLDCLSILSTTLFLVFLAFYLQIKSESLQKPVIYRAFSGPVETSSKDTKPFGSKNGTTYTFSWCQNSGQTKEMNKVYFKSAQEAEKAGRTLSKLCQK